jgi:ribosomal protein L11 methyltransferase
MALHVELPADLEEAVVSLLLDAGATGVVSEALAGEWLRLEVPFPAGDETAAACLLARYLASLAEMEPAARLVRVHAEEVPAVDWVGVARRHHRPVAVGRRFLVAPPWELPEAGDRELVVIEPGMAFGTGHHATTRGCLEAIETVLASGALVHTALDVGTGSGLLAIALARLGVRRVLAIDLDPAVLPLARANLVGNRADRVHLAGGTVACIRTRFDLEVANLLAATIIAEASALAGAVAPDGHLVVSGLRSEQTPAVRAAFPCWETLATGTEDGWETLTLGRDRRGQ